ncbi:MAG: 4-(cytidine 5'-diphospho)-2-C-methyl-D-erythritol kinase [Pseudomonadota bacterium]
MLTLPAPAKLNLFLHITGRRADGYHNLETVFQLLDYGDELTFSPNASAALSLSCSDPTLSTDDNLVLRAARLLAPLATTPPHCHIHLDKKVPAGGGLGGGSSDAATTLLALNRLWLCGLGTDQLAALGLQLGADVPVFVRGHSAFAAGVGEKLENQTLPERWYVVLTPACSVSTREIFSHPELTRNSPSLTMRAFPFSGCRNDCQAVSTQLYPPIKAALDWLRLFTQTAEPSMTGTGSSVFASVATREQAAEILSRLPTALPALQGCRGFIARGVNVSPLRTALDQLDQGQDTKAGQQQ